jgi:hypothetical protein
MLSGRGNRDPYLRFTREVKGRRRHADDLQGLAFEADRPTERRTAGSEIALGERKSHNRSAPCVLVVERAAEDWGGAKYREEIRRDQVSRRELGVVGHLQAHVAAVIEGDLLQRRCVGSDVDEVRPGHTGKYPALFRGAQVHDARRIRVIERL